MRMCRLYEFSRPLFACLAGLACLFAWLCAAGCGGSASYESYVPPESRSREAVELSLNAWKSGAAEGDERSLSGGVKVRVLDVDWREGGKKLAEFTIGEVRPAKGAEPQQIRVKLTYQGESSSIETTYYVVGIDPLLVFREEDYKRTSGG